MQAETAINRIMSETVSVTEAKAVLGLTDRRVRDFCNSGRLRAVQLGREWRVYLNSLGDKLGLEDFKLIERKGGRPAAREENSNV